MLRIRTLIFLLPVILLGQTLQNTRAAASPPRMAWKPGIYIGEMTISGHEYIALKPLPKGTLHEELSLDIFRSTGYMSIFILNDGQMRIYFSVPFDFRYKDWSQVEDIGSGICQGQRSESVGTTSLHARIWEDQVPLGDSFLVKPSPFELTAHKGLTVQFGDRCPEVNDKTMQTSLEAGFNAIFVNGIVFTVELDIPEGMSGKCTMPGFQSTGDLVFKCRWVVWNTYKE